MPDELLCQPAVVKWPGFDYHRQQRPVLLLLSQRRVEQQVEPKADVGVLTDLDCPTIVDFAGHPGFQALGHVELVYEARRTVGERGIGNEHACVEAGGHVLPPRPACRYQHRPAGLMVAGTTIAEGPADTDEGYP